jgi:type VI secretion system FHA domain protein
MDVLMARAEIKNEMRLDVTTLHSTENNPIKFSVSVDDALTHLLAPQAKGYMPPVLAVEEAFEDIRAHQIAVLAGIQSALKSILKRFDPESLEQRLQKTSPLSASIPIHRQAKLWELFEQLYDEIGREAEDDFNYLFGRAFVKAYEEQIDNIKMSQKHKSD